MTAPRTSPKTPKPSFGDPAEGLPGIPVGTLVRDRASGRLGTLRDVLVHRPADELPGPDARAGRRLAFLRPVGGGCEWTTDPDQVVRADAEGDGAP
ncbi:hypothetical protein [Streptomyces sp. NPDC014805]|uniref:hypothetical protein n=1 Tax=Streptomyces sp. NPDC014805 TaxID=3364919 RepID=UPI0036F82F53